MAMALKAIDGGLLLSPCCNASVFGDLNDWEDDEPFWDGLFCESCGGDVHPDDVVVGASICTGKGAGSDKEAD